MTEPDGPTVKEYGDRIAESEAKLVAARAAVAERETQDAETRLERARKLSDRFPNGQPPRPSADGHEIELQVLRALQDWEYSSSHPIRGDLAGVSVEEIEQELAAFDEKAEPRYPSPGRLPIVMTVAFGLLCAAGIGVAAFLPDFRITGLVLLGVGIAGVLGALAWPVVNRSREQARAGREQAILGAARNSIVQRLENRRMEEARHRSEHEQRSRSLKALNDAAIACDIGAVLPADQAQALRGWQERRRELLREYEVLGKLWDELQQLLGEISLDEFAKRAERLRHDMVSLVAIADEEFLADARKRDLSSERLDRLVRETQENRIGWERARAKRQEQEEQYRANVRRVEAAADALRVAAVAAEVEATDAAGLAEALSGWQARRTRSVGQAEERSRLWDELQRNLGGNSLEEVAMEAERLRANAKKRAGEVGERALSEAMSGHPSPDLLASLRSRAKYIEDDWNVERGQLEELGKSQRSVADAEDELAEAERELERVRQLDKTLETTMRFLGSAQEEVHRDIAPVLRATVLECLPAVTGDRYTDCRIDPADLRVEVSGQGSRWRDAALLSHGTAEQVYLLLRLALARHLTNGSRERCPLILDDAVGASDGSRKRATLEALLVISESTQVILFTHEDDVRDWARNRLASASNSLVELGGSRVPV